MRIKLIKTLVMFSVVGLSHQVSAADSTFKDGTAETENRIDQLFERINTLKESLANDNSELGNTENQVAQNVPAPSQVIKKKTELLKKEIKVVKEEAKIIESEVAPPKAPEYKCVANFPCIPFCAKPPPPGNKWLRPTSSIHGFIKVVGAKADRSFVASFSPAGFNVPFNRNKERHHSRFLMDARETRFWIDSNYEVCSIKISGKIEVDFTSGDGNNIFTNSRHLRLRKSYVRFGFPNNWTVLVGQDFTIMSMLYLDYPWRYAFGDSSGPAGYSYARQPQVTIGYTHPIPDRGELRFWVSMEQQSIHHAADARIALDPREGEPFKYPLLSAKAEWLKWEPFQIAICAGISQNRFIIVDSGKKTESLAWFGKLGLQSKICDALTLYGGYSHLEGFNRMVWVFYIDAVLNDADRIRNTVTDNVYGAFSWEICKDTVISASAGLSYAKEIHDTAFSGDIYRKFVSYQVYLYRAFWGSFRTGVGYKHWENRTFSGIPGSMNAVGFDLRFFF